MAKSIFRNIFEANKNPAVHSLQNLAQWVNYQREWVCRMTVFRTVDVR